ncbi:hypothetical protein [Parasitella parasitica]|uniref:Uncharacterized protein n=1 Tax=Parasitella parasitica TaxID=35722 RepID=A0A0B7MZL6_9FUNG|nr:hypothetical protein [Parasitella parasitica]
MSALQFEQDFPIGFAEDRSQPEEDSTDFYVEWLDNTSEFPGLSAAASLSSANLTAGSWELLQRKELNEEDNLVEEDDGAWSKINTSQEHPLYAQIVEKNATELQPTKRNVQPLWSNTHKSKAKAQNAIEDLDNNQDDLGTELLGIHKSQSRRANRMTRRRNYHDLRVLDFRVDGVFRMATTRNGTDITWLPSSDCDQNLVISNLGCTLFNLDINTRPEALRYAARYKHNVQKFSYKILKSSTSSKHPLFPDGREYSVHSAIVKN